MLTFRRHLESVRKILTTCVGLLKQLAGSNSGAGAKTLSTITLALEHSAAEYCLPVWCRSAHTRLINKPISDALRIVTGCLRPTPIDNLFVLASILPTELRRKQAVLSLARRAQRPEHMLNERLLSPPYRKHLQLKSRHPFVPAALKLLKDFLSQRPVWHVGRKPNGIRNGKVTPLANVLSSPTSTPNYWECIYPDHLWSGLTVSALVLVYSVLQCTDGVWLTQPPVSVGRRSKPLII